MSAADRTMSQGALGLVQDKDKKWRVCEVIGVDGDAAVVDFLYKGKERRPRVKKSDLKLLSPGDALLLDADQRPLYPTESTATQPPSAEVYPYKLDSTGSASSVESPSTKEAATNDHAETPQGAHTSLLGESPVAVIKGAPKEPKNPFKRQKTTKERPASLGDGLESFTSTPIDVAVGDEEAPVSSAGGHSDIHGSAVRVASAASSPFNDRMSTAPGTRGGLVVLKLDGTRLRKFGANSRPTEVLVAKLSGGTMGKATAVNKEASKLNTGIGLQASPAQHIRLRSPEESEQDYHDRSFLPETLNVLRHARKEDLSFTEAGIVALSLLNDSSSCREQFLKLESFYRQQFLQELQVLHTQDRAYQDSSHAHNMEHGFMYLLVRASETHNAAIPDSLNWDRLSISITPDMAKTYQSSSEFESPILPKCPKNPLKKSENITDRCQHGRFDLQDRRGERDHFHTYCNPGLGSHLHLHTTVVRGETGDEEECS